MVNISSKAPGRNEKRKLRPENKENQTDVDELLESARAGGPATQEGVSSYKVR